MPRVMETVVYRIDELEDGAKEKAREWWCCSFDDDWHESVIDDFCRICSILGVQLKTTARSLYGGGTREEPSVWFRGFWSQGDGACFEGRYAYQPKAPQRIRDYAPTDSDLHAIADQLYAAQRRNFYQLYADIRHRARTAHAPPRKRSPRRCAISQTGSFPRLSANMTTRPRTQWSTRSSP